MSSTYVADTSDDHKADNTLIIIVNNDGTVSVDQETLQNLLANQHNTPVSLVRLSGHSHGDDSSQDSNGTCDSQNDGNPHVNLTVEGFYPPAAIPEVPAPVPADPEPLVDPEPEPDPFLEMDSEQLKRLETALQSEQAKQILGENVTAMLDMLSVDEQASHLKDTIRMDHCYTSLTPASAPPTPPPTSNSQYGVSGSDGDYDRDNSNKPHSSLSTGVGATTQSQQIVRGRGRGRGPGRPRKEANVPRGVSTAYRGGTMSGRGIVGRGGAVRIQRGGAVGTAGGSNVVMMQQIKAITPLAPPPNSPSSASLVPLIRPLVLPAQTTTVQGIRTTVQTIAQNKVMTIPVMAGTTRFVTVAGKPLQVVDASGQQRVFVAAGPGTVTSQVSNHTTQVQVASSATKQEVTSSDQMKPSQDLGTSNLISGAQTLNQAKVVVAKMPAISPQLISAQPTSVVLDQSEEMLKSKDSEADFTDFHQEVVTDESEISEDEDDDADIDEDYKDSSSRRRGGRGGPKSRGGRYRGGRAKGRGRGFESSRGRSFESSRGRGFEPSRALVRGGRQRGGRGRGALRPEEADRVKKLELEMAAALAAMDSSPDREAMAKRMNSQASPKEELEQKTLPKPDEPLSSPLVDSSTLSPMKKKGIKVYSRNVPKKNLVVANKEVHMQGGGDAPVTDADEGERTPSSSSVVVEKKSPTAKNSIRKFFSLDPAPTSITSQAPTTPTSQVPPATEIAGKKYPKRENRKPPAHLVDAFGPALFSTPDIIRRVSTGESKAPSSGEISPQETKKEAVKVSPDGKPAMTTAVLQSEASTSAVTGKDEEMPVPVVTEPVEVVEKEMIDIVASPGSTVVIETLPLDPKAEEEVVASEDVIENTPELKEPKSVEITESKVKEVEVVSSTVQVPPPSKVETVPEPQPGTSEVETMTTTSVVVPKHVTSAAAATNTRSSRRRSSAAPQSPEPLGRGKQIAAAQSKEKKKQEDARAKARIMYVMRLRNTC